jgi:hypothetical protein
MILASPVGRLSGTNSRQVQGMWFERDGDGIGTGDSDDSQLYGEKGNVEAPDRNERCGNFIGCEGMF